MINPKVNIPKIYEILDKIIFSKGEISDQDKLNLLRFKDKLTDSEKFCLSVNREFSRMELINKKDEVEKLLDIHACINLGANADLWWDGYSGNWVMDINNEMFLKDLDTKLARNIAMDINVAFKVKHSQLVKRKN